MDATAPNPMRHAKRQLKKLSEVLPYMNSPAGVETLLRQGQKATRVPDPPIMHTNVFPRRLPCMQNYVEQLSKKLNGPGARRSSTRRRLSLEPSPLQYDADHKGSVRNGDWYKAATAKLQQLHEQIMARGCADASAQPSRHRALALVPSGPCGSSCGSDAPAAAPTAAPRDASGPCTNTKRPTLTRQPPSFPVDRIIPAGAGLKPTDFPDAATLRRVGAEDTRRLDNRPSTSSHRPDEGRQRTPAMGACRRAPTRGWRDTLPARIELGEIATC